MDCDLEQSLAIGNQTQSIEYGMCIYIHQSYYVVQRLLRLIMHICIGRSGSKNQGLLQLRGSEKISGIMEAGVESVGVVDESLVAGTNESNRNGEGLCYLFVYGKSYKFENKIVVNKFFIHRN